MILAFLFVFIVYRTVSYIFERTIEAQRNRSERFKIISVYILTGNIFDNLRQWHSTYAHGIATLELELFRQRQKANELYATNQLSGYIHYCTEIPEINISLLPMQFSP